MTTLFRNSSKQKCFYIVTETNSLNPFTGAGKHIKVGIEELSKAFDVKLLLFCKPFNPLLNQESIRIQNSKLQYFKKKIPRWIKWGRILIKNHLAFFRYYREIKSNRPDIIYERAAYLNFNGLIISKLLHIPHFFEINGISSLDKAVYFSNVCNKTSIFLEKKAYNSTFGFYVGGLNYEIGIPESNRAVIIQNGIEDSFISKLEDSKTKLERLDKKINLVFVGHAMDHHRLDILFLALQRINNKESFRLHLVGSNFQKYESFFSERNVETILYDTRDHSQLKYLLKNMDIGIVPFALDYHSNMKVFLYGAVPLLIMLPQTRNFKNIFADCDVIFFQNNNIDSLVESFNQIALTFFERIDEINKKKERTMKKIENNYTWSTIYGSIIAHMASVLSKGSTVSKYRGSVNFMKKKQNDC